MVNSNKDSQVNESEIEYDNLLDYFAYYLFPLAIKIGMTPVQFWEENPDTMWAYWDAYEMKYKDQLRLINESNFQLGQYMCLALSQCLQFTKHPKQIYPKQPFKLSFENNKKSKLSQKDYEELRKIQMQELAKRFNK